jgi:hypothetical protein
MSASAGEFAFIVAHLYCKREHNDAEKRAVGNSVYLVQGVRKKLKSSEHQMTYMISVFDTLKPAADRMIPLRRPASVTDNLPRAA